MTAVVSQMRAGRQPPPSLSSRIIRSAYLRALASSGSRGPPCRRAPYNIEAHRISLAATLVPVDCMYWFLSNPLGLLSSSLFSVADLLFALRFFGAHNPRRSNLHQYSLILFRRSVRQPFTFCRVLAEAVGVIVHDTSHLPLFPKFPSANRELQALFRFKSASVTEPNRLSRVWRALTWGRRNGRVARWRSLRTIGGTPPNAFD
jgi:hypothetical protein